MRNLLASCLLLAACGPSQTQFTVGGKTLTVQEQNFGKADYYCNTLANGEFLVTLTDFAACDQVKSNMNKAFHTVDETNMRFIFPSTLLKVPPDNHFQVGKSDCSTQSTPGTEAVVYFSHNDPGTMKYDVNTQADSGSITINYNDYNVKANELKGSFDLMFGSDHVSGSFDALFCAGLVPGIGS